jgi:hypothetical protein
MQAAVALVDVLDDLLSPRALDVHVDVGRPVAGRGQEPFEQEAQLDRVRVGDPEREADRRVGRRAAALAIDVVAPAELDDVPHHQEVAGEPERLDHFELVVELRPRTPNPLGPPGPVAPARPLLDQLDQVAHLVGPLRDRERREPRREQPEVEGQVAPELARALDRTGIAGEPPGLLGRRTEVGARAAGQPAVHLIERATGPHRGQGLGEPVARRRRVVGVGGGDRVDPVRDGQPDQCVVAGRVERLVVMPQLDGHVVPSETLDQPVEGPGGECRPPQGQRGRHRPLAAPGEHHPVATVGIEEPLEREGRVPLLPAGQLGLRDDPTQPRVTARVPGQDDQVRPLGVGDAVLAAGEVEGQLGTEHGRQADRPGRLGEADHAVEAVVVGERERVEAEPGSLCDQLFWMGGPVEKAEVGVDVQLGVAGPLSHGRPAQS